MHRRSQGSQALIPFDPEIEAAARRRNSEVRRKWRAEVSMAQDNRVLRDYILPQASGITSSIVSPAVEANNFELSPAPSLLWSENSSLDTPRRTPMRIFANSLRSAIPLRSMGHLAMLSDCGSFLFHWGIEPAIGYRTRSPTRSPPGTHSLGPVSYTHLTLPTNREV